MAASGCGATDEEPRSSTEQALSGAYYVSWGGTMNWDSSAYTNGAPPNIQIGVNEKDNWFCALAGVSGNLTEPAVVIVTTDSAGNWWLSAQAAPNNPVSAAAVCFPLTGSKGFGDYPPSGSVSASSIEIISGVVGDPAQITVSDQGTNPNIYPLHDGTWTLTKNNIDSYSVEVAFWTGAQDYSSYWNWFATGTSFSETLPIGTSCFLTSINGNLRQNTYSNGAWASVNFSTGVWTFTAGPGTTAWWLCLD